MSVTRDIFFKSAGSISEIAALLNRATTPEEPLVISTVESPSASWQIAEGVIDGYPAVLTDAGESGDIVSPDLNWSLGLYCAMRPGEGYSEYWMRCTQEAASIMRRIGSALKTQCVLLEDMQRKVATYP